jgi:hypothetical protein
VRIDIVQELSEEIEDSLDVKALWHAKYVELEADDSSYLLGDPGAILGPLQTAGALNPVEYRGPQGRICLPGKAVKRALGVGRLTSD